jgi:hypothetical protein
LEERGRKLSRLVIVVKGGVHELPIFKAQISNPVPEPLSSLIDVCRGAWRSSGLGESALASVSSSLTLDAVTAEEGYPIERYYYYVAPAITGYYSAEWNSADLRSGRTVKKGHLGNTTKSAIH